MRKFKNWEAISEDINCKVMRWNCANVEGLYKSKWGDDSCNANFLRELNYQE